MLSIGRPRCDAQLASRRQRLARCCEGSEASAEAWLGEASMGYLLGRV
jgi:hypothetical protein